jgi:enoyl-CoA hydratase
MLIEERGWMQTAKAWRKPREGGLMVDYGVYEHLIVDRQDGIALITMNRPEVYNATNGRLHYELGRIWLDIGADPNIRVAVITGAGKAFSAGGDLDLIEAFLGDAAAIANTMKEASDLVYNIINLDKPVISAINGIAVGAGLAVALLADISIASEEARFTDGHIRLGVGAGDHSVIIWPLLCGMARAKRYLLTADFLDAQEAERIGLVSMVVPHEQLMPTAIEFARKLATGPQPAIRWTKRALNQWLRMMGPAFDYSLATEMLTFFGPDVREGLQALREKRQPNFPSAQE